MQITQELCLYSFFLQVNVQHIQENLSSNISSVNEIIQLLQWKNKYNNLGVIYYQYYAFIWTFRSSILIIFLESHKDYDSLKIPN